MTPERWREVDAVVRGALAQPAATRAAFVADACRGDATLRREVEELLAVRTGEFLMRPAAVSFAAAEDAATYTRASAALAGRYVLEREVGRGGMATVYLARDLRHERRVAVKVLHPELAAVVGGARFLTEIRTTAALQHPHILPLFDSGSTDGEGGKSDGVGLLYYVMPYVEGQTLRARLASEVQLSVGDAVRIATEVASALEYAHRHGVIHRDIKPENILLGEDGQALVADFGIALAITHAAGERLTQSGLSLGTPQYMAPEQAAGARTVDARADVYALGAVTYEMLAGEPPFTGPSAQAIIARVMTESPRTLAVQRPSVPPQVDLAVRTALQKLPADRFASASAFATALATSSVEIANPLSAGMPIRRLLPIMAAAGTALFGIATALGWAAGTLRARVSSAQPPAERFAITLDSGFLNYYSDPAISPDGRTIVYVADGPDGTQLYARPLDQLTAHRLARTEGAQQPFFSPDGKWVGYFSRGALHKTQLDGGTPLTVVDHLPVTTRSTPACAWDKDDIITCGAVDGTSASLFRVTADGQTRSAVHLADTTVGVAMPRPLPGGKAMLVTITKGPSPSQMQVAVLNLSTGVLTPFGIGQGARYVGRAVVYVSPDGELLRQPFDVNRLERAGTPEVITKDIDIFYTGRPGFDVSEDGTLVYCPVISGVKNRTTLRVTDSTGHTQQVIEAPMAWVPRLSPNGHHVAYGAVARGRRDGDLWMTDLTTGTKQLLTTDGKDDDDPQWSPDGKAIAYSINTPTGTEKQLVVRTVEGGEEHRFAPRRGTQWPSDWTPDGRAVVFTDNRDSIGGAGESVEVQEIWIAPLDGSPARPYLTSPAHQRAARLSGDGRWAAYVSDETGRDEVYLQSYPTPGHKLLVSVGGGDAPMWRRGGRELYYLHVDTLIAVTFDGSGVDAPLKVRARTPLFRAPFVQNAHANYDVSRDGTRFVLLPGNMRSNRLVVAVHALGDGRPTAR